MQNAHTSKDPQFPPGVGVGPMAKELKNHPILRINAPRAEDIAAFRRDGFAVFSDVFTDEGLAGITDEILSLEAVVDYLDESEEELGRLESTNRLRMKPWNDKGPWAERLFDAPLVTALLRALVGDSFHFCHSTLHLSCPGAGAIAFHQDHHHWKHDNPVNLAERDTWYIQMLYYPNGFKRGDTSLSVIPGSHRIEPTSNVTPETLLDGTHDDRAGRRLMAEDLELPPGSMVLLNARTFHAVAPKPLLSAQAYRIFANYIFKAAGPPHLFTQAIPAEWMQRAGPERKKLFRRAPYSPGCWSRSSR